MTARNPYAIAKGDRVVFTSGYPVFANGVVVGRKTLEVRGVVEAIEFEEPWPDGMAYIDIDLTSIPPECWHPRYADAPRAAIKLENVRHDRSRAA